MARHNTYTLEQEAFLREHASGISRLELTNLFNKEFEANKSVLAIKGWCNRREIYSGNDGKFKKGHVSWQTGLSKEDYKGHFTEESYNRSIAPLKDKRVHSIGDTVTRHGELYVITSVEPGVPYGKRMMVKRRYVYESAYGKIPKSHRIIQIDGNNLNCEPGNLACIPTKFVPMLNKHRWLSSGNPEVTITAIKLCELHEAIKGTMGNIQDNPELKEVQNGQKTLC